MKSREDLLREARREIEERSVQEVRDHLEAGEEPLFLDVRGLDEWERGHLEGAIHLPRGHLEEQVESTIPDKSRETVVYCAGGIRSLLAATSLKALGYDRVISMDGGFDAWEAAGFSVTKPPPPEEEEGPLNADLLENEIAHLEQVLARKRSLLQQQKRPS
jgi:rhodanese-related sulfurtransferase